MERKMKPVSKIITASAAALSTFVLVAIASPAAQAGEYCRTDSSFMTSCSFSSLEQCQASASGRGGTCARDPLYKNPGSALAYQPRHTRQVKPSAEQ
jgi:hypothetical protein